MSRHVVLIHRYFQPDSPPYAAILGCIAADLVGRGHRVTVLTCQPSYRPDAPTAPRREIVDGVRIVRWPVLADRRSHLLKLLNAAWYAIRLALVTPRLGRVDTVMAASTPPVVEGMAGRLVAGLKRARFVYHHQDIYPEVAAGGGRGRTVAGVVRRLDSATDRASDAVVVLSEDMRGLVQARGVSSDRVVVLNNFDPWTYPDVDDEVPEPSEVLRVLYAGNLGRFQNLPALFDVLSELADEPRVRFDFVGDGALVGELETLITDRGLENVRYHGYEAPAALSERIRRQADVGLVSLWPGVIRAAYPSKVMSYLRNGLPVLGLVERDSHLARDLRARRAGWVVDPSRPIDLADTLRELAGAPATVSAARRAARAMYDEQFRPERALARWSTVLASGGTGDGG